MADPPFIPHFTIDQTPQMVVGRAVKLSDQPFRVPGGSAFGAAGGTTRPLRLERTAERMTLGQAAVLLRAGRWIRRTSWGAGIYIAKEATRNESLVDQYILEDELAHVITTTLSVLTLSDLSASDWETYAEAV